MIYVGTKKYAPSIIGERKRFGAGLDSLLGVVDENGVLLPAQGNTVLSFDGVVKLSMYAIQGKFAGATNLLGVVFPDLVQVESGGLYDAFRDSSIEYAEFPKFVRTTGYELYCTFYGCKKLKRVSMPSIEKLDANGGCGCFSLTFADCTLLESVDLSGLKTLGIGGIGGQSFRECVSLRRMDFPSLVEITHANGIAVNAFNYCTNLLEIHFRADAQAAIESMSGYSSKWGATNATIYFDL